MSTGKKISDLDSAKILDHSDMFVVVTSDRQDKRVTAKVLFTAMHKPKTVAEAKANNYVQGEIVNIIDYSSTSIAHAPFMAFVYTKKPAWFSNDVPDAVYEVNGSGGKTLLLNLSLTTSSGLVLTIEQANQLKHLLNNTGKIFYEPTKKLLCTMNNDAVQSIALQPLLEMEKL